MTSTGLLKVDSDLAATREHTTEEINEFLEPDCSVDSEPEEDDTPNDSPSMQSTSDKEVTDMASKILLYATESPKHL